MSTLQYIIVYFIRKILEKSPPPFNNLTIDNLILAPKARKVNYIYYIYNLYNGYAIDNFEY